MRDRSVPTPALVGLGTDEQSGRVNSPVSLAEYRQRRQESPWTRILAELPREERLMYAGMAADEAQLIDVLAFDPDPSVRRCVALHPSTTLRGQWELARDPDATIRERLARNPCAEPEILDYLSRDDDVAVRTSVATNTSTPAEVRRRLVRDAQACTPVRSRAAGPERLEGAPRGSGVLA